MQRSTFLHNSSRQSRTTLIIAIVAFVAQLAFAQSESVLYNFGGSSDGSQPYGGVIADSAGNLYGTTSAGGTANCGTVFELSPSGGGWTKTTLHSFSRFDGCAPMQGLVMDSSGNLYGTTRYGGSKTNGSGVVFELQRAAGQWNEITLHKFIFDGIRQFDGAAPNSTLTFDAKGNLYGTTEFGGKGKCLNINDLADSTFLPPKSIPPQGCGMVFELSPNSDGTWAEAVLHDFAGKYDGGLPLSGVVIDSQGNLYGTASNGGLLWTPNCNSFYDLGCGVVYSLSRGGDGTWTETVLHKFRGVFDGANPLGGLTFDGAGNLYGTTASYFYNSTVFELSRTSGGSWSERTIYDLHGSGPWDGVTLDSAGNLYAMTYSGGTNGWGIVLQLTPTPKGWSETVLHDFASAPSDGAQPGYGSLLLNNGVLYGTTIYGGTYNSGTVFAVTP
jgi:uncharacterized repeat protein (TIGR03803 family)